MKIKFLTSVIAATLMSLSASALADNHSHDNDWSVIEDKIKSASGSEAVIDPMTPDFQVKFGEEYIPVMISGVRFLTNETADFLMRPDSVFYLGEGEVTPLRDMMFELDLEKTGDKWPSLSVPEGVEKAGDVYVFTDPTCGYCRQFEEGVDAYLNAGIQVNYIPFPRAGVTSTTNQGYQLWAGALCSDENVGEKFHELMTDASATYDMPESGAECLSRLHEGYAYGRSMGISGTPFIFATNGEGEFAGFAGLVEPSQVASQIGVLIRSRSNSGL